MKKIPKKIRGILLITLALSMFFVPLCILTSFSVVLKATIFAILITAALVVFGLLIGLGVNYLCD